MIVSAVCFRRSPTGPEFLLVRTKGGRFWTFPKGHVEPGESNPESASREAIEEAGARGRVAPEPLGEYVYPGGSGPESGERRVIAYLLEVEAQEAPEEDWRHPTWCVPDEARKKLGEGRETIYGEEQARILDAALERIENRDSP